MRVIQFTCVISCIFLQFSAFICAIETLEDPNEDTDKIAIGSPTEPTTDQEETNTLLTVDIGGDPTIKPREDDEELLVTIRQPPIPDRSESEESGAEGDSHSDKFMSERAHITIEHVDFVQLRLSHIAKRTTSDITEIRLVQEKEFEMNEVYKSGWEMGKWEYESSKKEQLFSKFPNTSAVHTVPDEYHIALIAYSMEGYPVALFRDFNKKTREVCSGMDISKYHYKSYFKILLLAIESLAKDMQLKSDKPSLYRGTSTPFTIEPGQILSFQHFISTSSNFDTARFFSKMKTLFQFQGHYENALSLSDHSVFVEQEFLISPFQIFELESINEEMQPTRYVLIAHQPNSTSQLN